MGHVAKMIYLKFGRVRLKAILILKSVKAAVVLQLQSPQQGPARTRLATRSAKRMHVGAPGPNIRNKWRLTVKSSAVPASFNLINNSLKYSIPLLFIPFCSSTQTTLHFFPILNSSLQVLTTSTFVRFLFAMKHVVRLRYCEDKSGVHFLVLISDKSSVLQS